jgi:drug/metabolite transporter (DMT)-like permease
MVDHVTVLRMTAHVSRAKLIAAFAAIYFIWGSTYLAIKFAIQSIPPFMVGATRFVLAGVLLYTYARLSSGIKPEKKHWRDGIILGVFLLGVGNGCVVWAQQRIPSGITALVVAIVPLLVVLIEWFRPTGKRPSGAAMLGVVIGLAGMALLIGPSAFLGAGDVDPAGALVLFLGSVSWSVATVFGKRASVPPAPPLASAIQLLGGALCLIVASSVAGEPARVELAEISPRAMLAVAYLTIFGSIVAFSAYSWLLRVASPTKIATYAYVNPIVAMFLGWVFAGEEMSARVLMAAAIVLAGVALITRRRE